MSRCAGAADHQIGPGVSPRHVLDEGRNLGLDARLGIALLGDLGVLFAGLVEHFRPQFGGDLPALRATACSAVRHPGCRPAPADAADDEPGCLAGFQKQFLRTGLPVVRRLALELKVSGKASQTRLANGTRLRWRYQATAFCSWITSGTPASLAASPPGPVT